MKVVEFPYVRTESKYPPGHQAIVLILPVIWIERDTTEQPKKPRRVTPTGESKARAPVK